MTIKQAVIYCRISEDKSDGKAVAVERQERECQAWAEEHDIAVTHVYIDNSISATKGKRRPEFEKMLKAKPSAIIAWHQDRIVRLTKELERLIELDIPIYTVQAGMLDLSTAQGRAVARTVAAWSTYEGEHKASRQLSAITEFFSDGEPVPGKRRFGYLPADKALKRRVNIKKHPDEAPVVAWLFKSYLDGRSIASLARELGWRPLRVRETLANPAYAGYVVRRGEVREAADYIDRIVSETVYKKVEARLKASKGDHHVGGVIKHLVSGVAFCGVCGGPLSYRNSYLCLRDLSHPTIKGSILETRVKQEIAAALIYAPEASIPGSARLHAIEARLVELTRTEEELAEAMGGGMSWSAVKPQQEAVNVERVALKKEKTALLAQSVQASMLATIRSDIIDVQTRRVSIEKAAQLKVELIERFDALEIGQRRELIQGHLDIRVDKGRGAGRIRVRHLIATSLNDIEEAA